MSALVVEPDAERQMQVVDALARAGFEVTATDRFDTARRLIAASPPAVIVTALKLGEYNGLHLVLRARVAAPHTAALVTSPDPTLDFSREVSQLGAIFLVHPVTSLDLVACALRLLFRKFPSERVDPPFERRVAERRNRGADHFPNRRVGERRRDAHSLFQALNVG